MLTRSRAIRSEPAGFSLVLCACLLIGGLAPDPAAASRKQADEWPEITPAERELVKVDADSQAAIVILDNQRHGKILHQADDWVNVIECHWRAKILTEAGRRFSEVHIPGGKSSRVTGVQARTIKPDGTIVVLPEDQIFQKTTVSGTGYKRFEWVFNFPAVEPGVIVEYRYKRHDDNLAFIEPFYFEGPGLTLKASVSQAMPDEMGYSALCSRCPQGVQPAIKPWREGPARGTRYTVELTNLPGFADEMMMPPRRDVSPHLEMVLHGWTGAYIDALGRSDRVFTDWDSVARWAEFHYDKAAKEGQREIKTLVTGWVQGIEDPQEKAKAIIRHVQSDFRYLPWENVIGSTRSVSMILKDMSADNEERAMLTVAALRSIGVKAHYALVSGNDAGTVNPAFFSFSQFTHTVVALPAGSGYEWIDPTVSYAPHGFIPWKDSGAKALLITAGKGQLVDLPVKGEPSRTNYLVTVKAGESGRADLTIEAEYANEDAVDMRSELSPESEQGRKDFMKSWLERKQPGASLGPFTIENLDKLDEPLKIRMQATAGGALTLTDQVLLMPGCLISCLSSNPIVQTDRRYPLSVGRGWNIQETVVMQPPEGMKPAAMPPATQMDSGVARISLSCTPGDDGGARCLRVFTAARKLWPQSLMERVRRMYDEVVKADRTTVAFEKESGS